MHPTDSQLEGYAKRTLDPGDLLSVDDHLSACDACRGRAVALARAPGPLSDLRGDLLPVESHLSDEQLGEYVAGGLSAADKASVDAHIGACRTCAREVDDLRTWARRRPRLRWGAYAAAAAVLIALLIPSVMLWHSFRGHDERLESSLAGLETLPGEQQQRVRAALQAGVAEPPAHLADLGGGPEALMGASSAESFRLLEPLATVSVSDRPTFRWETLAGAETYAVSVSDEALHPVVQSPAVPRPPWTPDQSLPRGRTYMWQVTARRGAQSVTVPAPPALPARFMVLDEQSSRLLEAVARDHPQAHLLVGILYAQAGARADAEAHLAQVPRTDPYFDTAQRTLERLRSGRSPR